MVARIATLALLACTPSALVAQGPPNYATFEREQVATHAPDPDELLRIWMIYVDQGDGLLIQLPTRCNYDPRPNDGSAARTERVEILIDGGSNPTSQADRLANFIDTLYGGTTPTMEYAVLTHHDQDHVAGMTRLLADTAIPVERMFHNGLASYCGGARGFPTNSAPTNAVYDFKSGQLKRGMAFLEADGERMQASYLIDDLASLDARHDAGEFQGVYQDLAAAVTSRAPAIAMKSFQKACRGAPFIGESEASLNRGVDLTGIQFQILWPKAPCCRYGNWGETINGNSVVFKLVYGSFEMLFTGDMNELSEDALLDELGAGAAAALACDVLKVPHHGSKHGVRGFFDAAAPVLSVASMGETGFKSKQISGSGAWQHPSTDVIRWLGGAHRVYCTEVHEKPFRWDDLTTEAELEAMRERSNILIETDGEWFRVVEIPESRPDLLTNVPSVQATRRSNGTQWVRASPQ